jgi:hypothetical protein
MNNKSPRNRELNISIRRYAQLLVGLWLSVTAPRNSQLSYRSAWRRRVLVSLPRPGYRSSSGSQRGSALHSARLIACRTISNADFERRPRYDVNPARIFFSLSGGPRNGTALDPHYHQQKFSHLLVKIDCGVTFQVSPLEAPFGLACWPAGGASDTATDS